MRASGRLGPCPPTACLPRDCVWPLGGSGRACLAHSGVGFITVCEMQVPLDLILPTFQLRKQPQTVGVPCMSPEVMSRPAGSPSEPSWPGPGVKASAFTHGWVRGVSHPASLNLTFLTRR